MKKFLTAAALVAGMTGLAHAGEVTLKFDGAAGVRTVTIDSDANTLTSDKGTAPYTWDDATHKLCAQTGEGEHCITLGASIHDIGESTTFTSDDGDEGTVSIVSSK